MGRDCFHVAITEAADFIDFSDQSVCLCVFVRVDICISLSEIYEFFSLLKNPQKRFYSNQIYGLNIAESSHYLLRQRRNNEHISPFC